MTDNVTASAGTADGATFATDDDGTAHHPYVKLEFGADNTQTKVSSSDPLPVTDAALDAAIGTPSSSAPSKGVALLINNAGTAQQLGGLLVTNISGAVPPVIGPAAHDVATPSDANPVQVGAYASASAPTAVSADGDVVRLWADKNGRLQVGVASALPAGTNNIGDVDIASIAAGSNLIGDVGLGVRTSGGTTPYKNLDVDESEDQVKGTAGQVYWIHAINLATAVRYLKFYNATAANVTVGTTTPVLTFPIPTQAETADGAGFVLSIPNGIAFDTAITIAATTGIADSNTGAPGANEVIVNLGYK